MKSILISIRPEWVEKILNGEKTIEIRKTMPKCELPCKVYIYCTKSKPYILDNRKYNWLSNKYDLINYCGAKYDKDALNGKVVAEFTLNKVKEYKYIYYVSSFEEGFFTKRGKELEYSKTCIKLHEILHYATNSKNLPKSIHAWHIDNLKIYDKPKELSEFSGFIPNNKCEKHENGFACEKCDAYDKEHETCLALYYCHKPIKQPPQSWCYVESL